MTEVERIRDLLRRSLEGEAWHGPSLRELLDGVDAAAAGARPVAGAHTIWELVGHISAWMSTVARRLGGEEVAFLAPDQDWPAPAAPTEAAWQRTLGELAASHERLRTAMAKVSADRLDTPVPGKPYSVCVMLHGVVQHNLYHGGQIGLLKKTQAGP